VGSNLRDASALWDDWFAAEPSLTTFALRSLFRDLIDRGWDDPQGVPSPDYQRFAGGVLPVLNRIVGTLAVTPSAEPVDAVDELAVAYRDSLRP
jgi:hypothetical protein